MNPLPLSKEELSDLIFNQRKNYTDIAKIKGLDRKIVSKIAKFFDIVKPYQYTINDLKKHAISKKGTCLSKIYIDANTSYQWKCNKGHKWNASWNQIINRNTWCRKCSAKARANEQKLTIEEMQDIAKKRNGKCISKKYEKNSTKLKWICADGHSFEMCAKDIKEGSWCPECSSGVNERKCRFILETIFNKNFPNVKKILNDKYELDGFNNELKLAFEYQGEQHYRYIPTWHGTSEKFEKIKEIDKLKK